MIPAFEINQQPIFQMEMKETTSRLDESTLVFMHPKNENDVIEFFSERDLGDEDTGDLFEA